MASKGFISRSFENIGIFGRALVAVVAHFPLFALIGARNLVQAKRRTLLLGAALAFVTVLFVLLQGLLQGATDSMIRSATTLSAGHVNIGGFFKQNLTDSTPVVLRAAELRRIVEENTPGLDYVIDRQRGWAKIVSDTSSQFVGLTGIDPAEETRLVTSLALAEESSYKPDGKLDRKGDLGKIGLPQTIVLFATQAKRLGIEVGDSVTITTQTFKGSTNSAQLTVVAICEDIGLLSSWSTFVSKKMVRDLYALQEDTTGAVMVYLKDIEESEMVMGTLREVLLKKGFTLMDHESSPFFAKFQTVQGEDWTGQKLDLTTWRDEVSFLVQIVTAIKFVSVLLLAILLGIIVIGIMNAMWIAVRERTQEIGTLRAVGMGQESVLAMFLTEASLLGLGASGFGLVLAILTTLLINAVHVKLTEAFRLVLVSDTLYVALTPAILVITLLLFTAVTALASLVPAFRAAKMQPVTAIQSVS